MSRLYVIEKRCSVQKVDQEHVMQCTAYHTICHTPAINGMPDKKTILKLTWRSSFLAEQSPDGGNQVAGSLPDRLFTLNRVGKFFHTMQLNSRCFLPQGD